MLRKCDDFLVHYNWLANYAARNLRLYYNIVFKLHHLWHIVYHARFLNPAMIWCYEFEDFVGTMLTCAEGCMHGSPLLIVGHKCLENYLLVLQLRLRH